MVNLPLVNPELYDLQNDPGESYDVAAEYPHVVDEIRREVYRMLPTFPPEVQTAWNNTLQQKTQSCDAGSLPVVQQ